MSDANRVAVRYVAESTYNTTPVDSVNWKTLRFTAESLGAEAQVGESEEIRSDRMVSDLILNGLTPGGGISAELSSGTYDDFIEAVMGSAWSTDVVVAGTSDFSFTFEKQFQDITGDQYVNFTGMRIGQMDLAVEYGSRVTAEFTLAGGGAAHAAASLVGLGTVADPTTTPVMDASAHLSGIKIDGIAADECIRSLNLSINANMRPKECLGSITPSDQVKGSLGITGDFSIYLDDLDLDKDRIANNSISLEFTISRAGVGYTFLLPNLKLGGNTPASTGINNDVFFEASFTALYDVTEDTNLKITRF